MKRIVTLTEKDLRRVITKIIKENCFDGWTKAEDDFLMRERLPKGWEKIEREDDEPIYRDEDYNEYVKDEYGKFKPIENDILQESAFCKTYEEADQCRDDLAEYIESLKDIDVVKQIATSLLYQLSPDEAAQWGANQGYISVGDDDELTDPNDDPDVYTMDTWNNDKTFKANPGQNVSDKVYDQLLNDMPPEYYKDGYMQPGEPVSHNKGVPQYHTFNGNRYVGAKPSMNRR